MFYLVCVLVVRPLLRQQGRYGHGSGVEPIVVNKLIVPSLRKGDTLGLGKARVCVHTYVRAAGDGRKIRLEKKQ